MRLVGLVNPGLFLRLPKQEVGEMDTTILSLQKPQKAKNATAYTATYMTDGLSATN